MTWAVLGSIILFSLIKIMMTCLPTGVVEWLLNQFRVHEALRSTDVSISYGDVPLEDEDKDQMIVFFNQANLLETHYVWPGAEHLYAGNGGVPFIITMRGKSSASIRLFDGGDHIAVIKQSKRKLIAYSLGSEQLLQHMSRTSAQDTPDRACPIEEAKPSPLISARSVQ
ncbi:YfmQ family protein [Xylanibacillus composti]|uniref:Uncharacterized protein n=1 Tax=Xylanibacillus composti TaxID=1572762 RepID=A0A8J4H231_9BACL|nr:YfmQ family protein [Xylanibacillus composti]GIQ69479.1 hypothetical protein XYCOK13_23030 [Xylanibacillus composti]